jgi:hypothetical protein
VVANEALSRLAARIEPRVDDIAVELTDLVLAEIEPYRSGVVDRAEVQRSMAANYRYLLAHLRDEQPPDFAAPRETGRRRSELGLPLPDLLRAYRIGFTRLWHILVDEARRSGETTYESLVDAASEVWALADTYAQEATEAYRAATAQQLLSDAKRRATLIEAVLTGDLTEQGTLWDIAEQLRLPVHGVFVVVAAETTAIGQDPLAQVEARLAAIDVASAWRLLPGIEVGLISCRRAGRVRDALDIVAGLATGRVGASSVFDRVDGAADALRLARIAMASVPPGVTAVHEFDARPLAVMVAADPESSRRTARVVLGGVLELPAEDRDTLLQTLTGWLDANGSATDAGRALYVHPNTVRHRLRRIEQHTGRSLSSPRETAELAVALQAVALFPDLAPADA